MINLFEYENKVELEEGFEELETFLDEIWKNREKTGYYYELDGQESRKEAQQFLQFLHKTDEIKSNKYVGVIHFEGRKINLLPKIFFDADRKYDNADINAIQQHILWWLSYCRKIRFPSYDTSLDSQKYDFFEILIYLFAKYTRQLLGHTIYQQYEEVEQEVQYVRGRLNMNRYIDQNLSKGRWHKVNCVFDPFRLDNRFNQIIKYVASILQKYTENEDSKKYLREILFTLNEVSEVKATADECNAIQFNPAFSEFEVVRDYCRLFLNHSVSFDYKNDLKLFAFLIPMEYLFEDFIYGFIEKEVDAIKATSQSTSTYLDRDNTFMLKPDLILSNDEGSLIADTKYKVIYENPDSSKQGISQSDLYQVLAYAVRLGIPEVALLYPDSIGNYQEENTAFTIHDEFADRLHINVYAYQLPIINRRLINNGIIRRQSIDDLFAETKEKLRDRILDISRKINRRS